MHEISPILRDGQVVPTAATPPRLSRVETKVVTLPSQLSRAEARKLLADEAEYGSWELARVVIFRGGRRKVWLRRRTMRVERTDLL